MREFGYDLMSRPTFTRDPLGRSVRTVYDSAGRATGRARGYRPNPNALEAILTNESTAYDAAGNATSHTDAEGDTTTLAYDAGNRLTGVVVPVAAGEAIATSYGYDAAGSLVRQTDGRGNTTRLVVNPWGLTESVVEPSTAAHSAAGDRTWTTTYDKGGLPVSERQPGGVIVARTFDALGRLTAESGSGGGLAAASRQLGYDRSGLLTQVNHPGGAISLGYDGRGLLTSATGGAGSSSFVYDGAGRMFRRTDEGATVQLEWDPRGMLKRVHDSLTNTTQSLTLNNAGQVHTVRTDDGQGGASTRTLGYDELGRLSSEVLKDKAGATAASFGYTYFKDDNVKTQTINLGTALDGTHTYSYDQADRLTGWTTPNGTTTAYDWDASGNRTQAGGVSFAYDERNRLTSDGTAGYAYNPRGDLVDVNTGGQHVGSGFDALGRMTSAAGATYTYDGLDRLATRNGATFAYAGTEIDPVKADTERYARSASGRLIATQAANSTGLAGFNRHGDLAYIHDGAGGIIDGRVFDPFGTVVSSNGMAPPAVGFQGDYTDPDTGQVWMGARWYTPTSAQFSSRDTYGGTPGDPLTLDRYAYGLANPLVYWDPDGHRPICGDQGNLDCDTPNAPAAQTAPPVPATDAPEGGASSSNPYREAYINGGVPSIVGTNDPFVACGPDAEYWGITDDNICSDVAYAQQAAHDNSLVTQIGMTIADVTGLNTAVDCLAGSASACVWTVLTFVGGPMVAKGAARLGAKALAKAAPSLSRSAAGRRVLKLLGSGADDAADDAALAAALDETDPADLLQPRRPAPTSPGRPGSSGPTVKPKSNKAKTSYTKPTSAKPAHTKPKAPARPSGATPARASSSTAPAAANSGDDLVRAAAARDVAGQQLGRKHATYAGGTKNGRVTVGCSSNPIGCAEDDIARQLGPHAQMTSAFGWRRNPATGQLEWTEIPVCVRCQGNYGPHQFPPDVKADPGGAWGVR